MIEAREALAEFLSESSENLEQLERELVATEDGPLDRARLDCIFRTLHTLKGTCGFFDFDGLGTLAHAGEDLLDQLRSGSIDWRPEITSALLSLVDAVRSHLKTIEASGLESVEDHTHVIAELDRLRHRTDSPKDRSVVPRARGEVSTDPHTNARQVQSRTQIRVDVDLLDRLMDLVGELVLARNRIVRDPSTRASKELTVATHRLDRITSELQDGVMKARMRPISVIWDQLPRVVRDLALICGKQARIEFEGGETELDRSVFEAIKDPILHLVRNAIDHGIEPPSQREAKGKPSHGVLKLRGSHSGGLVRIEISDDGAGIDPHRVAQRAVEVGLISADRARGIIDHDAIQLLFQPGFSTAEAVTEVSGRGVGLDVVRTNIESIGGTIQIRSRPGWGTTITIQVPLTLTILPTLVVADSLGDRYVIPRANLAELARRNQAASDPTFDLETVGGAVFARLRGELLPLVELDAVLGNPRDDLQNRTTLDIAILTADHYRFGLVIASAIDIEDVVAKPLGPALRGLVPYAGAAILGDGRVALVLDVVGLARRGGLAAPTNRRKTDTPQVPSSPMERDKARHVYLLFGGSRGRRYAVPLPQVARLEECTTLDIDQASGRPVIHRQGGLLPLIRLEEREPGQSIKLVVCDSAGQRVGLSVESILDIVTTNAEPSRIASVPGLVGSTILDGHATDILDLGTVGVGHFS
jgi:two-component system chemotaxis sensor kinase CheA